MPTKNTEEVKKGMQKNRIITTFILCAVICSCLAGYLIYRYMTPQRGTIYVFNRAYSAGTQVTSSMLTPMQVDANIITAGRRDHVSTRFVTPSEYSDIVRAGDSLRMDVSEGMPLTTAMLAVSGGSSIEMNMRSESIAITIPVTEITGVTNDLKEGARVNVYATIGNVTILLQQYKRVLEVFRSGGSICAIALEEDVAESMELIGAANNGKLYLGLVDATGYQLTEGPDPYMITDTSKYLNAVSTTTQETEFDDEMIAAILSSETEAQTQEETETEPETQAQEETETSSTSGDVVFTP